MCEYDWARVGESVEAAIHHYNIQLVFGTTLVKLVKSSLTIFLNTLHLLFLRVIK